MSAEGDEERRAPRIDSSITKGIIASVIASIVVILFVQPLLQALWSVTILVAGELYGGFVDRIYANAARQREIFGVFSFGGIAGGMTGFATFSWLSWLARRRPALQRPARKPLVLLIAILATVLAVLMYYVAVVEFGNVELNASFRQRVAILAPYLTDREEKELRAAWASMRRKVDYDEINGRLEAYARDRALRLPPARPR